MHNKLVSVIVAAYNAEKYIKDALESVLKQTYPYFEIIVVDDASTDKTADIVNSFLDERIRLLRHTKNQGPGAARNSALEIVKGRWIALLDADDQWLPDRLMRLLQEAEEAGAGVFVSDTTFLCFESPHGLRPWGNSLELYYNSRAFTKKDKLDLSLEEYLRLKSPAISPIIPLETIRHFGLKYEPGCFYFEDFEFYSHLFRAGLKLRLIKDSYYLYRMTPGSLTSRPGRVEEAKRVLKRILAIDGFSKSEVRLFEIALEALQFEGEYMQFTQALKSKNFKEALRLGLKKPRFILEFILRSPNTVRYRLKALMFRGHIK